MTAAQAVGDARTAARIRTVVLVAALLAGGLLSAASLAVLAWVVHGVAERAEKVASAAAYQQWTDCEEDLTDGQEAVFEEKIGDLLGASVAGDDARVAAVAAELDALDLTPDDATVIRECGPRPPRVVIE